MKILSRAAAFSFLFCFFALLTQSVSAQPVVINEIAWMGTETSFNDEWIELYNNTGSPIDLSGWKLAAKDGTPEINLTGKILALSFYLLERTDDNTLPNIVADQIYTGVLGNAGENFNLYDSSGNLIDSANCSSGWFAGDNLTKQTMERIDSQQIGINPANWKTSQGSGGTPKAKNSMATEIPPLKEEQPRLEPEKPTSTDELNSETAIQPEEINYPSGVVINEILPSPKGADAAEEWIEIFNQNQFEVDLSGWQIKDSEGTVTAFTVPAGNKIPALGFLVFSRPTTKITLNNDEDEISLIQPDNKIIETIGYSKAPQGQSYSRLGSEWSWTNQLTPGAKNIITETDSQIGKTESSEIAET